MQIDIHTLGCKVNQAESGSLEHFLSRYAGLEIFHGLCGHPWTVINSCAVTAVAAATCRKLIRRVHRQNPGGKIVVCGCLGALERETLLQIEGVVAVFGPGAWQQVARFILGQEGRPVELNDSLIAVAGYRTRPEVKIQDGCDGRCAYCTIPKARGASRSAPFSEVYEVVRAIDEQGYRELTLSGIHLGRYGLDLQPASNLAELLDKIIPLTKNVRFRLGSLEANEISAELLAVLARHRERLCPHFHIPLQSGCDEVLSRMNRPYDFAFFAQTVRQLKELFPQATLGTDIIIGHPGETTELFEKTMSNIKELPLDYYHIFPFSSRPDTPAARMVDKPSERQVKERLRQMQAHDHQCRLAWRRRQLGVTLQVILEQEEGDFLKGTSENYLEVKVPRQVGLMCSPQQVVGVDIKELRADGSLLGTVVGDPADFRL